MKDHIKTLETENEAIKLFMKEQLYVIKKSISDIKNEEAVNENVKLIEHLQKANEKLEQENGSKTTIIKILAENKTSNIPTTQSNTEQFKLVKRKTNHKNYKVKNERKPEIKYSNRYETLYITDSEEENESSNDESTTPEYSSGNPESRKKRKSKRRKSDKKNTYKKLHQDKNDNQERSQKTVSASAYNKTGQQKNPILRQKIRPTYRGAVSNKPKNILILSDSMLKTLRMREFNNHLEEGIAHLKAFPGSKSQQLNHHSIPILQEHEYDGAIIHVGINDLIKNPNENKDTTKIARDVIDIALQGRIHNISTVFISSIVYSTKVNYQLLCKLNNLLHEECVKNGFYFIDNSGVTERDLWKDGIHMVESGKCLVANNFICHLNNFLGLRNHPIWNW